MFKVGDRVRLLKDACDLKTLRKGMVGTVAELSMFPIVEWDKLKNGHDGDGDKKNHCWCVGVDDLEVIDV